MLVEHYDNIWIYHKAIMGLFAKQNLVFFMLVGYMVKLNCVNT